MPVSKISPRQMILVTSDVHLGGGSSLPELFLNFLEEVFLLTQTAKSEEELPKVLLILGDVFDVMMNTFENISKDFLRVFKLLDAIFAAGVRIIVTLGNHEVSVTSDHDARFTARKIEFIDTMKQFLEEQDFHCRFLNKRNFCQYVILNTNNSFAPPQWEMNLYDSKYQIPNNMPNNLRPILLGRSDRSTNHKILFCHGFQFFTSETKWAGEFVWNPLFKANPNTKDFINKFYNKSGIRDVVKSSVKLSQEFLENMWKEYDKSIQRDLLENAQLMIEEGKELRKTQKEKTKEATVSSLKDKKLSEYEHSNPQENQTQHQYNTSKIEPYDLDEEIEQQTKSVVEREISRGAVFGESLTGEEEQKLTEAATKEQEEANTKIGRFFSKIGNKVKKSAKKGYAKVKHYFKEDFFLTVLKNMIKTDETIRKMRRAQDVDERIVRFLKQEIFEDVKQVVFGHTHEKMRSFTKGITVVNDGAWQHVEPSFIEILSDGTSQIFEYPLHKLIRPPKKDEDSEQ